MGARAIEQRGCHAERSVRTTKIALVRHGLKEPVSGDAPLSTDGQNQATATALHLASWPIRAVYASPLRRATQTAQCIAERHSLPVQVDARLRERVNWGDLPGQSLGEFVAMWERSTADPHYVPPVGDSAHQAGARLGAFLQQIAAIWSQCAPSELVVAVTHGGLMTDFLVQTFSADLLDQWQPAFVARQSQLVAECSITLIEVTAAGHALQKFADTAHLSAPDRPGFPS